MAIANMLGDQIADGCSVEASHGKPVVAICAHGGAVRHPVRLRIVKAFLGDRALTTKQLAAELPDVPAGSIYRHVARLT